MSRQNPIQARVINTDVKQIKARGRDCEILNPRATSGRTGLGSWQTMQTWRGEKESKKEKKKMPLLRV
jgi:hypothetical protein